MFLDTFRLTSLVCQMQYAPAYVLWDRAGAIAKAITDIWPDVDIVEAQPQRQIFRSERVQIETALKFSTITLWQLDSIDRKVDQIKQTFDVWKNELALKEVSRISSKATYIKDADSLEKANSELLALGLVPWPSGKVFDQPDHGEKNSFDLTYRFEDEKSFSTLRVRTEQIIFELKLDPAFDPDAALERKKTKSRLVVDFDRGVLGAVSTNTFRVEDWLKGFQHLLRRDVDKVFRESNEHS
jgi:hypothetical protein